MEQIFILKKWIQKIILLLTIILGLYLQTSDEVYAQNITINNPNINIFSGNSMLKIDSILRIDQGIEARLYEYQIDQSKKLPLESQLLNAGLEQAKKKKYGQAINSYTKALQFNPMFAKAYVSRAYARSQLKQMKTAFKDYNTALEIDPNLVEAYIARGNLYFKEGEYQKAIQDFESAIAINKNYPDAYHGRGSVYLEMGKYEEAIEDFSEAISLNPQYPDAYVQREYAKSFLKDYEGWVNRGISSTALGRYQEALDYYDRALRYNTDDDTAWYNKAAIYALQGNVSSAVEHLQQAIKLNPERKEDARTDTDFDSIREQPEFKELFRSKRFFIF